MSKTFKIIMMVLGVLALLALAWWVVVQVQAPAGKPAPSAEPSAEPIPILEVTPVEDMCSADIIVACGSATPSATPSVSPSSSPSPSPSDVASAELDCVTKEVYADDARNKAGFYYLENRIADASTLTPNTVVTYNIIARNNGGIGTPDTKITDVLSTNLTFVDSDTDCAYDSPTRTLTCALGTLSAGAQTQRTFRAKITAASSTSIANKADVFSSNGQRDTCEVQLNTTTGAVVSSTAPLDAPTELPEAGVFEVTAGTMGVGLLFLILGGLGLLLL